jgi:hypothetical protein
VLCDPLLVMYKFPRKIKLSMYFTKDFGARPKINAEENVAEEW